MSTLPYGTTRKGMTTQMWKDYCDACDNAGICPPKFPNRPRITQTIGNAVASAGYHAKDGEIDGVPYCAAIDISVKGFVGEGGKVNEKQIRWFLWQLAKKGYVAWYRYTGSFRNNKHIHAVYAGVPMKAQLCNQVIDFLNDRTGLVGHAKEQFWTAPKDEDDIIRAMFAKSNPIAAGRI